jgi:hypothetical protein
MQTDSGTLGSYVAVDLMDTRVVVTSTEGTSTIRRCTFVSDCIHQNAVRLKEAALKTRVDIGETKAIPCGGLARDDVEILTSIWIRP